MHNWQTRLLPIRNMLYQLYGHVMLGVMSTWSLFCIKVMLVMSLVCRQVTKFMTMACLMSCNHGQKLCTKVELVMSCLVWW